MNLEEALSLGFDINKHLNNQNIKDFCNDLNSTNVFVTKGKHGYLYLRSDGYSEPNDGWVDNNFSSDLGAGDAFFSALCYSCLKNLAYNSGKTKVKIRNWVTKVMSIPDSNLLELPSEIPKNQNKNSTSIRDVLFTIVLLLSIALGSSGFYIQKNNPDLFLASLLVCGLLGGILGGISRDMLRQINLSQNIKESSEINTYRTKPEWPRIAISAVVGLGAGILFLIPQLTLGNRLDNYPKNIGNLAIFTIYTLIIGIGAGVLGEKYLPVFGKRASDVANIE